MDIPPSLLPSLPSLAPLLHSLRAILSSPYPPRSIYLRATSNLTLIQSILGTCLSETEHLTHLGDNDKAVVDPDPDYTSVQNALPRFVYVDCAELASQKALFGRILNGLSGWGNGQWDDSIGGVLNWDGKQEGYSLVPPEREDDSVNSTIQWHYRASTSSATPKGIMAERKDESMSGFLDGLRSVFTLGSSDTSIDPPKHRKRPRFVILHNAERLHSLESLPVGQTEGTMLACFLRLGELTRQPIVPVFVSSSEWLLLRPQRGATEPAAMLEMPALGHKDIPSFLPPYLLPSLPKSPLYSSAQHTSLLRSLVDYIYQTFSPYLGSELEDYIYLVEKLWPISLGRVMEGQVEIHDTKRMIALMRPDIVAEIDGLAELRPMVAAVSFAADAGAISEHDDDGVAPLSPVKTNGHIEGSSTLHTPTKFAQKATSPLPGFAGSPSFYSPSITPSKRALSSLTGMSNASSTSLPFSLPLLSRYILIAAFLASSNPSRKDLQMLATEESDLFSARKRKKGGGTRKTPNKKSTDGGSKKESMPQRLLGPKPFPLERLVAIVECILPFEIRDLAKSQDMLQEVSTLTNLRLLIRTSAGASSSVISGGTAISAFDKLDGIKLKCSNALELELVEAIGKSVDFKVSERLWEAM